jgi:hypothetical protein
MYVLQHRFEFSNQRVAPLALLITRLKSSPAAFRRLLGERGASPRLLTELGAGCTSELLRSVGHADWRYQATGKQIWLYVKVWEATISALTTERERGGYEARPRLTLGSPSRAQNHPK